jgi:hypothetical protein
METQIPLLPSENLPNCMPAEKRALTFGGALCSVSAGGEKNKFTSTRCSHDHVSCTHAYVSSSVLFQRDFFPVWKWKMHEFGKKSVKTVQFQLAFYFAVVAMLLGNYVNARVSSRRRSSLPPLLY